MVVTIEPGLYQVPSILDDAALTRVAGDRLDRKKLAAFADDKGANALANKLKRSGYAAYVQPVETSRGTQSMTHHPGHLRLGHRLELHRPVRRLCSAIAGDCRDARRNVRMSRQDGRKEAPIRRL